MNEARDRLNNEIIGISKERRLLEKIQKFLESDVENDFGFTSDIKYLLSQQEETKAVIVDTDYIAASIDFMKSQKNSEAKDREHLRDWFAGLAMQGIIDSLDADYIDAAAYAYEYADAMLKARDKAGTV